MWVAASLKLTYEVLVICLLHLSLLQLQLQQSCILIVIILRIIIRKVPVKTTTSYHQHMF